MEYVVGSALCMARVELEGGTHVTYPAVAEPRLLKTPWQPALFARSATVFRDVILLILGESRRAGVACRGVGGARSGLVRGSSQSGGDVGEGGESCQPGEQRVVSRLEAAGLSADLWLHAILPFCHPYWSTDEPPFVYRRKTSEDRSGQAAAW
jgi:hypothetical protein